MVMLVDLVDSLWSKKHVSDFTATTTAHNVSYGYISEGSMDGDDDDDDDTGYDYAPAA
ncbi:hypothetical protein CsatA_020455 [Cannabis sativa]